MSRGWPRRTIGQAGLKPSVMSKNDTVQLGDGTQIPLCRPKNVIDKDWASVKNYLTNHLSEAMALQNSVQGDNENPLQLDQFGARVHELEAHRSKGPVQQQQQQRGVATEEGKGEAVQYLFGATH